jgi:hypothetical protein
MLSNSRFLPQTGPFAVNLSSDADDGLTVL